MSDMMVVMADAPDSQPESRLSHWVQRNRLAAAATLGAIVGLVWGIATGVGFAVLSGSGVLSTWEVFVPGGLVIGSVVGLVLGRGSRSVTPSRP